MREVLYEELELMILGNIQHEIMTLNLFKRDSNKLLKHIYEFSGIPTDLLLVSSNFSLLAFFRMACLTDMSQLLSLSVITAVYKCPGKSSCKQK